MCGGCCHNIACNSQTQVSRSLTIKRRAEHNSTSFQISQRLLTTSRMRGSTGPEGPAWLSTQKPFRKCLGVSRLFCFISLRRRAGHGTWRDWVRVGGGREEPGAFSSGGLPRCCGSQNLPAACPGVHPKRGPKLPDFGSQVRFLPSKVSFEHGNDGNVKPVKQEYMAWCLACGIEQRHGLPRSFPCQSFLKSCMASAGASVGRGPAQSSRRLSAGKSAMPGGRGVLSFFDWAKVGFQLSKSGLPLPVAHILVHPNWALLAWTDGFNFEELTPV